jgi:glycosyltransferase involved in cell wall biosynthesis
MKTAKFFVDERHAWFDVTHPNWSMVNIGPDGSNLTVTFLSMNRASLSIRLVRSFIEQVPNFAGRFLIADNGSDSAELRQLKEFMKTECPFPYDILSFGMNYGVAGGRNRAFAAVKTDWILSLDNDIYLVCNPFPSLTRDIATLGCHFLSVPLLNPDGLTLYSFGGHLDLFLDDQHRPFLGTNCMVPSGDLRSRAAEISPDGEGFLCSFLFGGASLLRRETFLSAGSFDDGMLVGFEDIEFSLRLFRQGLKVGSSAVQAFIHDHPPASADSDRNYEQTRYSRQILHRSAEYVEGKHGFRVWNAGVEDWLMRREKEQGFESEASALPAQPAAKAPEARAPRIALVVDADNWAFANIARQIEKHLSDRYVFEIIPITRLWEIQHARLKDTGDFERAPDPFAQFLIRAPDFDLVHVFWRPYLTMLGTPNFYGDMLGKYANFLGLDLETFQQRFVAPAWFTTSVYDHLFLEGEQAALMSPVFSRHAAGYTVASPRLDRLYRYRTDAPPPTAVIPDGVDRQLFRPMNLKRFDDIGARGIVVGWVGNSAWAQDQAFDMKGVHSILIPAVEQLQAEGVELRLEMADRNVRHVPHHEMVDYYTSIDVLICTSAIEGTPNPVLEALACGVPIISTDVGIVPDALGPQQSRFVLSERSVECLKDALRALAQAPALFRTLSEENLRRAEDWDWAHQTAKFDAFFSQMLDQKRRARGEVDTKICMLPFTTPSQEPDGSIRLCSASSIFNYRAETNMGNAREQGLHAVWRGDKYRNVRDTLLRGGESLTPYCAACEYRHDGPAWLLQLHLALHAHHHGIRDPNVADLLQQRLDRYDQYASQAPSVGLLPYPRPEGVTRKTAVELSPPEALIEGTELPISLDLNTLNRCNVSCVMCPPAIKYDQGEKRDKYYRLTKDEFTRLTDGLSIKTAHFVGAYAEPLLNKEIFSLVHTAHERGIFTAITSNAMPLSQVFARKLIEAGLDMMSISLHGATPKTAEAIMLRSKFDKVVENIRGLQALKKEYGTNKPDLYFNFVSQLANVHEMGDFISLAGELGVRHVNIIHLIDGDEAVDKDANLVRYPDLLAPNVREAIRRGKELGVNVYVSPAYKDLMKAFEEPAIPG